MDYFELKEGSIHCEEVPLELIADEIGTPVYVYSASTLRRHARVISTYDTRGNIQINEIPKVPAAFKLKKLQCSISIR